MLQDLMSSFKSGIQLKGVISALQHLESIETNVIQNFNDSAEGKNKCIDALCGILQSMKTKVDV